MSILYLNPTQDPPDIFLSCHPEARSDEYRTGAIESRIYLKGRSIADALDQIKEEFDGVIIVHGAGRFTQVRSAAAVANALASSKNIPIAAIEAKEGEGLEDRIERGVKELKENPQKQIVPKYAASPNITKPKK